MRKFGVALAVGAALLVAGSLSWKAEATSAVKSEALPAMVKKFSLIEKRRAADGANIARRVTPGDAVRSGARAAPAS
jgi:hypothetical protein